ncbi:MAG TPA: signal peptidase II [Alphaproteobacteria bacterium]|nr:signal peptidase II [Alphaproteobacteria bacterium]
MPSVNRPYFWTSIVCGVCAFGIDRLQKYLQIDLGGWHGGEQVPVTPFLDYVLVWNTGVSYGLLAGLPVMALAAIAAVAMLGLGTWWWTTREPLVRIGLAICLGGALSNALDRLLYGAVADFFHLHWQGWSFYVFNLADAAITLGVLLLVIDLVRVRRPATD